MTQLRCIIERITYQNPENGYSVLRASVNGEKDLITVVGTVAEISVGTVLTVNGNWNISQKYGKQFMIERYEESLPATAYGIEKYLGSGLIKGIGPKTAGDIVKQFGVDTFDIIEYFPERLLEVNGIGKIKMKNILDGWEQQKEIKDIMMFLQANGVNSSLAAKIYKAYGKKSIEKVKANPYKLADDIWGIGFRTADRIATNLGFAKDGYPRIRSGIIYVLNELSNEGHTYATRQQIVKDGMELLELNTSLISSALDVMAMDEDVIQDQNAFYLPPFYYAENGIANRLTDLYYAPDKLSTHPEVTTEKVQRLTGTTYDDTQIEAMAAAVKSKVMILTGGPGTGKTTTVKGIIAVLKAVDAKILCAAPTGRAAKRMSEATGMQAITIHRLLEYGPNGGYNRNHDNPLEGDALIVDECSMIDTILMNALVKAIPQNMKLIMVGDTDQLPSVGAGNVLRDIIESNCFPVVRLTKIFRQAQSSRIIMNAHRVNHGQLPEIVNTADSDFFFIEQEDTKKALQTIVELATKRLPATYKVDPREVQILAPMKNGDIGTNTLNVELQKAINPNEKIPDENGIRRGGYLFKQGDKVMQIRNNYDKGVFNGDIGFIANIDKVEQEVTINFDGTDVVYDYGELDEVVLAYATTIHKSQGSEYPVVIMPVSMSHFVMLQRNLIYTGITRAKRILVIVGTRKAMGYAVKNDVVKERNTLLCARIRMAKSAMERYPASRT